MSQTYAKDYIDLAFEDILRIYRKRNLIQLLKHHKHSRFLEIGCGSDPLFQDVADFDKMVIVEPDKTFFEIARSLANNNKKIEILNNSIESLNNKSSDYEFDFIVIGGFLHEIDDPQSVLQAIKKYSNKDTLIYSFVPNANSFHRLLAISMNIIESVYEKSNNDVKFGRRVVYNINTYNSLFSENGYEIINSGTYFIKPFAHSQMDELLKNKIIDESCLDGLDRMIEFLPDFGAELWNLCKING